MSFRFRTAFYSLAPRWLTSGEGERVLYSLGFMLDAFLERLRQGLSASLPEHAPEDALAKLGRDALIVRGINEPSASYAARIRRALDDHRVRGNPFSLAEQLRAYCQADVRIRIVDQYGSFYTLDRDGSRTVNLNDTGDYGWDWDGTALANNWSRFWVIIYPTAAGEPWSANPPWRLRDGDMELADTSAWTSGGGATIEKSAAGPQAGTRYLHIIKNGAEGSAYQLNCLHPGTRYNGWYHGDGADTYCAISDGLTTLAQSTVSGTWQSFSVVPTGNDLYIYARPDDANPGSCGVDSIFSSPLLWGDGLWGHPDKTIGTTATPYQCAAVRSIIRQWKPAHAKCEWIIIAFDDSSFAPGSAEPDGGWLHFGKISAGAEVRARLNTARYWRGP